MSILRALTLDMAVTAGVAVIATLAVEHGWGWFKALQAKAQAKAKAATDELYDKIKSQVDVAVAAKLADVPQAIAGIKDLGGRVAAIETTLAAAANKVAGA